MDAIIPVDTPEIDENVSDESFRLRTDNIMKTTLIDENEIRSVDVIEPIAKTTYSTSGGFDVQRVYQAFLAVLKEPQNPQSPINTQDYINGYRELLK
jgi:hypothetical protein